MLHTLKPRVVELGKIKIGRKSSEVRQGKGGGTWRAPEKLDHFVVTGLERDSKGDLKEDKELMGRLLDLTGATDGKLKEIPIVLLSDEIEDVLQASYVWYAGRTVTARCDGTTCTWYRDKKGNPIEKAVPCNGEHESLVDDKGNRRFKPHGVLNCVIAAGASRFGGVYKLRTTSIITLEQLYGGLLHIQALTGGFLRNVPLRLVVRPMEVSPGGRATTVYVCHVELRGADLSEIQRQVVALAQTQVERHRELAAVRRDYLALLKAPGEDESDEEMADVAEEFHPGVENALPAADAPSSPPADDIEDADFLDVQPEREEAPVSAALSSAPAEPEPPAPPPARRRRAAAKAPPAAAPQREEEAPPHPALNLDDLPF